MPSVRGDDAVLVVGLGRFGWSVARQLMRLGHDVLAIERNAALVESRAPHLTLCVEGDATSTTLLENLGVPDMKHAVVAIGESLENSVLAVAALSDLGVPQIWAKASNTAHGRILDRVGATRVVFPEQEMGNRVAHGITERVNEYIEFANGYALTLVAAPKRIVGLTLQESDLRSAHGVTAVGVERVDGSMAPVTPQTRIRGDERLVIAGRTADVEKFAYTDRKE